MKKSQPVMYHGPFRDEIIYSGLIYTQSNTKTFLGKPRKVLKAKSIIKQNGKTLKKTQRLKLK